MKIYRKRPVLGVAAADASRDGIVVVDTGSRVADTEFLDEVVSHLREIEGEDSRYAVSGIDTSAGGWTYFILDYGRLTLDEANAIVRAAFLQR